MKEAIIRFKKGKYFKEGLDLIYKDNIRTNGEFYVDNLIEPLINLEDSLYNPDNFFYYNDFKFQALQDILKSKKKL